MRYRLRHLLMVVLAVAVVCGYYAPKWRERREYEALAKAQREVLTRLGIRREFFDAQVMFKQRSTDILMLLQRDGPLLPGLMNGIRGLRVEKVYLEETGFTNEDAKALAEVRGLKSASLAANPISDDACEAIGRIETLEFLNIYKTDVGDTGIERLRGLEKLRRLSLGRTKITDASLRTLAEMKNLTDLQLTFTSITDEGLELLGNSKHLRKLELSGTKVSSAGLRKLQEQLPECEITQSESLWWMD